MFKILVLCSTLFMIASALQIHEYGEHEHLEHAQHEQHEKETEHHHEIDHKHATSHQSVKFHHFHPVPLYVKKEDEHLLKKPIEIGGTKQKLKILHPETEHNHNHGLVLENQSESDLHAHGHYEEPHHIEHYEHYHHE